MKYLRISLLISLIIFSSSQARSQINVIVKNSEAEQVLLGNYKPSKYSASVVLDEPADYICGINDRVSPDSLKSYLEGMSTFHNRNNFSDTVSNTTGIGAARRWAHMKFKQFSQQNENRLITSYLQFDYTGGSCGPG